MPIPEWGANCIPVATGHNALYMVYQRNNATGRVLNIGVGGDPIGFGDNVIHFDIDRWRYPWFVQGDAHNLPFKDNSFDTAVMGDILEHLENPLQALKEAHRVAPKLVLTAFEEWRLGGLGQNIERATEYYLNITLADEPDLLERFPEEKVSHAKHINQFDDEAIENLLEEAGWKIEQMAKVSPGVHEGHTMYNWLLVARRS
uniref:Putative methyltransferase n=1 Tax=viral metagenome TaxID=1070528 RepID=A0A6H1ZKX0_9ZZZZ